MTPNLYRLFCSSRLFLVIAIGPCSVVSLLFATQFLQAQDPVSAATTELELPWKRVTWLADREINESSGIVLSQRNDKCFWTHNDSGDVPRLFLVHRDGRTIARLKVLGIKAIDWEDLAFATIGGSPKIIVGDIGGNAQKRDFVTLHILAEPSFVFDDSRPTKPIEASAFVETSMNVRFNRGITNYEGIAVSHAENSILIFEKALLGGRVYSVPLPQVLKGIVEVEAKQIGHTSIPLASSCDISADSRSMVVITYNLGFFFRRRTSAVGAVEDWSETLKREPLTFALPKMRQPEAVCFSADAKSIFLTSEQLPTPIIEMTFPAWIDKSQ